MPAARSPARRPTARERRGAHGPPRPSPAPRAPTDAAAPPSRAARRLPAPRALGRADRRAGGCRVEVVPRAPFAAASRSRREDRKRDAPVEERAPDHDSLDAELVEGVEVGNAADAAGRDDGRVGELDDAPHEVEIRSAERAVA